ncbi:hypothetical protein PXK16_20595 [Phaeobacter gallaeciensis]|nr:hypothetical protein [Phaeobacter gallaeciensis]
MIIFAEWSSASAFLIVVLLVPKCRANGSSVRTCPVSNRPASMASLIAWEIDMYLGIMDKF